MDDKLNFVVLLSTDWDDFHRKSSLLPLAKNGKVLLVQRTADIPVSSVFFPKRIKDIIKRKNPSVLSENLFLFRPFALIHEIIAEKVPFIKKINQIILKKQFSKIIKRLNLHSSPLVLIVYHPFQANFIPLFEKSLVIYECYDEYSEAPAISSRKKRTIYEQEMKIIQASDIVITTAKGLYNNKKEKHMHTYFLPNGVDYDFFSSIHSDEVKISKIVEDIPSPIIGFLGDLNDARDIKLLSWLSLRRPEWSFLFVGRNKLTSKSDQILYEEMKMQKNVHLIGWLPQSELLGVCKVFDVGLIPSKTDSAFAKYMFPNKLFEYLAMGLPIVSTDMPELRPFGDIIKISKSKEEFELNLCDALNEKSNDSMNYRLQVAKDNSWIKRCEKIVDIINSHI